MSGNFLPTFRDNLSVPYSGSKNPVLFDSWTLKGGPIGCPETSVINNHYSQRNNSEQRSTHTSVSYTKYTIRYKLIFCMRWARHVERMVEEGRV